MIHRILVAAMWAGLLSLDFTACGPWMIAQPLVCGPLFGWMMGQVAVGVIIGGVVQLLWMDLSPVGVGIPYDATAVTLLAVFIATIHERTALSQVILALIIAVPLGFLFRWMDQYSRRLNAPIMRRVESAPDAYLPAAIWGGILAGLAWSWLRYTVAYALAMAAGYTFWKWLSYTPRLTPIDQGLTMAVILLPLAGMGVVLELFLSEEPEGRWSPFRGGSKARKNERTPG